MRCVSPLLIVNLRIELRSGSALSQGRVALGDFDEVAPYAGEQCVGGGGEVEAMTRRNMIIALGVLGIAALTFGAAPPDRGRMAGGDREAAALSTKSKI